MTLLECGSFWDCASSLVLGGSSLILVIAFSLAGKRFASSASNRPALGDLVIFTLSAIQSFFFASYYLLADRSSVLVLFLRSLKSFQILLISGLLIMMQGQLAGSSAVTSNRWQSIFPWVSLSIFGTFIVAAVFEPSNPHCRDFSWLLISLSQVVLLSFLARISLGLIGKAASPVHQASVIGNTSETSKLRLPRIEVERQPSEIRSIWLLALLVGVEGASSLVNLAWDVVFVAWLQRTKLDSCHSIAFNSPAEFLESAAFLLSEVLTAIAPQAAVYYVFYWQSRRNYSSFQQNWDLDLP